MRFDAVIFDIDNVLVDTRASYTDCIRKTVETYLETILKFQPSRSSLLSRQDVETFKFLGGFNDDWDTCYGLLLYLLHVKIKKCSIHELAKQKNISGFVQNAKRKPLGVNGVEKIFGKQGAVSLDKIAEIFQRFYLSDFVWAEKLLISKSFLKQLKQLGLKIGIVTGRSHDEAEFALRRFRIDPLIDTMVTTDETPKNLKKPHPYGLFKTAAKLGQKLRYLYVGDLPDDILAARRARKKIKIASCGYLKASGQKKEMRRELKKAKADFICTKPQELMRIIWPTRRQS